MAVAHQRIDGWASNMARIRVVPDRGTPPAKRPHQSLSARTVARDDDRYYQPMKINGELLSTERGSASPPAAAAAAKIRSSTTRGIGR